MHKKNTEVDRYTWALNRKWHAQILFSL